MPTISVIVPVYKVEAYLDRCVQSILDQTFEDFELILVDDGSPDRCGEMCDEWAKKDSRIRVIHKENGGLSDARNIGIESAWGEYFTFVDSDDYIHPQMLEILYTVAENHGKKLAVGGFGRTRGEALPDAGDWQITMWKPAEFYRNRIVDATIACAKLYHRNCFSDLRFPVGKIHEDEFTTYQILFDCELIPMVDIPLYGYYCNENSITNTVWSPKRLDILDAFRQQIMHFKKKGYIGLEVMRVRDYVKYIVRFIDEIWQSKDRECYMSEYRYLKSHGRVFLLRYWKTGEFQLEKDGWMVGYFFPKTVKIYSLILVVLNKIGIRKFNA